MSNTKHLNICLSLKNYIIIVLILPKNNRYLKVNVTTAFEWKEWSLDLQ